MDVDAVLSALRAAVDDLATAADRAERGWTMPRAPGKWSPSQVVEHVTRTLIEGAHVVAGRPSKFPTIPAFIRPIVRVFFFKAVLKKGAFSKSKTPDGFDPETGSGTPAEAKGSLMTAMDSFSEACRERAASGEAIVSGVFGAVSVVDYARFQAIHTRHHTAQIGVSPD